MSPPSPLHIVSTSGQNPALPFCSLAEGPQKGQLHLGAIYPRDAGRKAGPWCQPLNHSGCLQLGDLLHWKLRMVHPKQDFDGGANSARAQINRGATGAQSGCRGRWPCHRRWRPRPNWPAQSWGHPSISWQKAAGGLDGYLVAWRSCTACRPVDRRKWAGGMTDSQGTSLKVPSPRQPATGTGLQGKLGPLLLT